jgi:hypothetical protein
VNPADGLNVPLSLTGAAPTVVPPEQSDGAEASGPNTLKVTVPLGEDPPESAANTSDAAIALPAVPVDGAVSDSDGEAADTVVSTMPGPHVVSVQLLSASPL